MKRFLRVLFLAGLLSCGTLLAQDLKVTPIPAEFLPVTTPEWGNDVVISGREPIGRPSGAGRSNGTAFMAIPDTTIVAGGALVVYKTTNFGDSWVSTLYVSPAFPIEKCKMVRTSDDSIHVFFLGQSLIRYFNVERPVIRTLDSTGIRDFDVAVSSQGGTYLFYDMQRNNNIYRAASSDAGATWPQRALVSSNSCFPRVFMNYTYTGLDSLLLNFFGPVNTVDTLKSVIRQARYRETLAGNLASAGFSDVNTDTTVRSEYGSVKIGTTIWFFNTKGTQGSIDIECKVSTNSGTSYGAPILAAGNPNVDEYWFDVKNYAISNGGVDFVYYADSVGATGNNTTDRLMYAFATTGSPNIFSGRGQVSEHPPTWSARGYSPTLFEYYDAGGESGVIWVGLDSGQKKVYYDRYNGTLTGVRSSGDVAPESFVLLQNYPNPFNPSTTIAFSISANAYVKLAVFDLLGREVQTLVAQELPAGLYKTSFDAGSLASGVYLFALQAGKFSQTKKMMLVK